jgi:8-oxo-dGTP pyrophosphatase MutT (NUDIX family)
VEETLSHTTRDFAATTFVVRDDCTLLLWHLKTQAWLPPGGHIEPDELPEDAARREVLEETGFEVELLDEQQAWGKVKVLRTPVCLLLENISPEHQHIDLIYFARITGGSLNINLEEASASRWYSHRDLGGTEIAEDIRVLGQRAIAAVSSS